MFKTFALTSVSKSLKLVPLTIKFPFESSIILSPNVGRPADIKKVPGFISCPYKPVGIEIMLAFLYKTLCCNK